jgi:hypothetical protein
MTRASNSAFARIALYRCQPINRMASAGVEFVQGQRKAKCVEPGPRSPIRGYARQTAPQSG